MTSEIYKFDYLQDSNLLLLKTDIMAFFKAQYELGLIRPRNSFIKSDRAHPMTLVLIF